MEHPKDREFRKAYEKAVASGDAQGSMARDYIKTRVDNMFTEVKE